MIPKINIVLAPNKVTVQQGLPKITVAKDFPKITIIGTNNMLNILPFSVTATVNGQKVFTLPYVYKTVICFFIMGTGQDVLAGDYTIIGNTATLGLTAPTIQIGDIVFGAGQV